jgi:hypothetical protein
LKQEELWIWGAVDGSLRYRHATRKARSWTEHERRKKNAVNTRAGKRASAPAREREEKSTDVQTGKQQDGWARKTSSVETVLATGKSIAEWKLAQKQILRG